MPAREPRTKSGRSPAHERRASVNRVEGIRSRYQRCPQCKKLRMKWLTANWHHEGRKNWEKNAEGVLVCFICVERNAK